MWMQAIQTFAVDRPMTAIEANAFSGRYLELTKPQNQEFAATALFADECKMQSILIRTFRNGRVQINALKRETFIVE